MVDCEIYDSFEVRGGTVQLYFVCSFSTSAKKVKTSSNYELQIIFFNRTAKNIYSHNKFHKIKQ